MGPAGRCDRGAGRRAARFRRSRRRRVPHRLPALIDVGRSGEPSHLRLKLRHTLVVDRRRIVLRVVISAIHQGGTTTMCKLCDAGMPQDHSGSRRNFLKAAAATPLAAAGANLFAARPSAADDGGDPPADSGRPGRRYVIRGGAVMSMDPQVGDFARADVLVEGKKIIAVGPNIDARGASVIDARGRIVMPGFIDTHHHQFETALRSFLANGVLIDDGSGSPSANGNYFGYILLTFAPVYR